MGNFLKKLSKGANFALDGSEISVSVLLGASSSRRGAKRSLETSLIMEIQDGYVVLDYWWPSAVLRDFAEFLRNAYVISTFDHNAFN